MNGAMLQTHVVEPMIKDPETSHSTGCIGSYDDESDGDSALSNKTDSEDKPTVLDSEVTQDPPAVENRPHKPRKQNQLTNDTFVI